MIFKALNMRLESYFEFSISSIKFSRCFSFRSLINFFFFLVISFFFLFQSLSFFSVVAFIYFFIQISLFFI